MTSVYVSIIIVSIKLQNSDNNPTLFYYRATLYLVSTIVDWYVDLFLLWLLYRFMRPSKIKRDKNTALLFAHDFDQAEKFL